jgi:antibiotic biosynthesis monooxygenase (ABM) superfamily enzyme
MQLLQAAKLWVILWATIATFSACLAFRALAPPDLRTWPATASLLLIGAGLCLLLTDFFFLNVKTVAFTGEPPREQSNLAMTVLKYFTFFPVIVWIPVVAEPWIEISVQHFLLAVVAILGTHLALLGVYRRIIQEHCAMPGLEDDEEDFPMKLGLRY